MSVLWQSTASVVERLKREPSNGHSSVLREGTASVLDRLRDSPKGQLSYNRKHLEPDAMKVLLEKVSPVPLSRHHEERESSKFNLSFGLDASSFEDVDNSVNNKNHNQTETGIFTQDMLRFNTSDSLEDEEEKQDASKEDQESELEITKGRNVNITIKSPESARFGISSLAIKDEEQKWQEKLSHALMERCSVFDEHDRAVTYLMGQKELEIKRKLDHLKDSRQNMMDRKIQQGAEETQRLLQKLKENNQEHQKKIVIKNKEIQQQRMKLEEEERKRQAIRREKLETLRSVFRQIDENRLKFIQLHDNCPHKDKLNEIVNKYRLVLESVCSKLALQVQQVENLPQIPVDDVIQAFEGHKAKSHHAVEFLKKEMGEADTKLKQEEERKKEEELKKVEDAKKKEEAKKLEAQAAEDCGVQALAFVLKDLQAKQQKLAEVEAGLQPFINNQQMKKYRFDLQRAVNTPINAISAVSGSHLRDKLKRLHDLLNSQPVEVSGKRVVANQTQEGPLFCLNLVAKMLVRKGEEQVTSKHDSAFAISAVVVGLWADFPLVGELFMAHLQTLCPYVLPFYAPRQEGQSSADYHKSLGYKISEDGSIEEQDKFLRRMSGLMRLYCACLVAVPLKGANSPHPHGLEQAWMWLARTLNLEPQPDVTATVIHDVLSVTGHALVLEYRVQFVKLVHAIHKHYLPKLKSVSVTSAAVGRLEIFLETTMKNSCRIPPPEGLLQPNFFQT